VLVLQGSALGAMSLTFKRWTWAFAFEGLAQRPYDRK
jgi:hypothetical protein